MLPSQKSLDDATVQASSETSDMQTASLVLEAMNYGNSVSTSVVLIQIPQTKSDQARGSTGLLLLAAKIDEKRWRTMFDGLTTLR